MKRITCILALLFAFSGMAAEPLRIDFTRVRPLVEKGKLGSFSGELTEGWRPDYPDWNGSIASGREVDDNTEHFLQLEVTRLGSMGPQFYREIPRLTPGQAYRLTVHWRNRLGGGAELVFRQVGAPYGTLRRFDLPPDGSWRKEEFRFEADRELPGAQGLFLLLKGVGKFDLVSAELAEIPPEELAADREAALRRPVAGAVNFLPHSSLPLGPQAGWSFRREKTPQWRLSAENGPSGERYVILTDTVLLTAPFQVREPDKKHTFSFSYRGKGIVREAWANFRKLPESREWKRAAFSFVPHPAARSYAFRLEADGELSLDAFRVAPGDDAEFRPAAPCEISFALPDSELAASRIQFDTEPSRLAYHISGNVPDSELAVTIADLYGREKCFILPAAKDGVIDYGVFPDRSLGQFRVEAVLRRDGKEISPHFEFVVTRIPRPVCWNRDAPESPFGIHAIANDPVLKALKAAGVNHVRLHDAGADYIAWAYLEPEKGRWRFRDAELQLYRSNRLLLTATLFLTPEWAATGGDRPEVRRLSGYSLHRVRTVVPADLKDFTNYVSTVAARYRNVIREYIVWNEPWSNLRQKVEAGGRVADFEFDARAAAYFRMQKAAYGAIRQVDPALRVVGYNANAAPHGIRWARELDRLGAYRCCDIADYHYYSDSYCGGDDGAASSVRSMRAAAPGAARKPLYMTEGQGANKSTANEGLGDFTGLYRNAIPWRSRDDNWMLAELQTRFLVSMIASGVKKVFLYSAHTYEGLQKRPDFLALLGADGWPHPQLAAHSALARRLEGKSCRSRQEVRPGLYCYVFTGGGRSVAVLVPEKSLPEYSFAVPRLPGAAASDLFGNPLADEVRRRNVLYYLEADTDAATLLQAVRRNLGAPRQR